MKIVEEPWPSGQPLAEALINNYSSVEHLYGYNPRFDESWSNRLDYLHSSDSKRADRSKLVKVLREFNHRYNSHEAVDKALDKLALKETAVIVGGQQSGLFTGPLLVIYKAVTIIKAAQHAAAKLGQHVVPVFWIAGEDHDWDEVNHTYVLSSDLHVSRIRIPRDSDHRRPVSWTEVSHEEWEEAAQELEQLLPGSEFKESMMDVFKQAAMESATLTECFARLMGSWFGRYGLILLDSADPGLRALEVDVFEDIINRNDEMEQAYHISADEVVGLGYAPQADVARDGANLFYINDGERLLLFKQNGKFCDRKGKVAFTREELLAELMSHPDRFSNNVLTRPIMQECMLPVLGTVLGNGEIAYWALTGRAFHTLGLEMPILLPRESFTVMEGTLQKHMEKYGLSWDDVKDRDHLNNKRDSWLSEQDALHLDEQFDEIKAAFTGMYNPLIDQLGGIQNGLVKLGNANRDKIVDQIEYLRGKAKDALAKTNEAGLRHFDRIELSLFPQNKLQERVYNVFYYLNRYGEDWIDGLVNIPYDVTGTHRVIYL
ncbi:bacillithiol biosynthesis cysteine-adding enzyme BshC [Fontibacillus panacisegetis]|uniref:Putative cysteine ligase BshC n=1 Tax=Fontibacillus panacisegetis TaxID=670482 RepID=A0A1G7FN87_9BACL|nr:bacillithiol biosynthesis cysteine-adding enzyme BshC [Fontibacillus panacisegetis]SDE77372.1 bacillithiol biosynthesis cysteine-adding enzyme BshC [Fontibacillus panacisegetis]